MSSRFNLFSTTILGNENKTPVFITQYIFQKEIYFYYKFPEV